MTAKIMTPEIKPAHLNDVADIAAFNARIHDDPLIVATIKDLILMKKIDPIERGFLLARNPQTNEVISSCCLIPQDICYGSVLLQAGVPEFVGTDPAFRQKGLISKQFDQLHKWSEENGDDLQLIAGIPNFYRQYGYEMTVSLAARRTGSVVSLQALPECQHELLFQPAVERDIPELMKLFAQERQGNLLVHHWSEKDWRYTLLDGQNKGCAAKQIILIRRKNNTLIGALKLHQKNEDGRFCILGAEIDPVLTTWDEVQPALMHYFKKTVEHVVEKEAKQLNQIGLQLPENHPLYVRLAHLFPNEYHGYAWYVRIPHLLKFIKKVTPVLDENIRNSPYRGVTRTVNLNLYSMGLRLVFTKGRLEQIKAWTADSWEAGDFLCPEKGFYHLLLGHRSFSELHHLYADCYAKQDTGALMDACFPKRVSFLYPAL